VAPAGPAADPWIGQVVNGKFRILSLLGEGGMGRVYKAKHLTLERSVVLKMLHRGLTADPSVAHRFHREAKAASRLVHPHSIQVLDFGEAEDGTLFMAMEYLSGRDLARILEKAGPMPEDRIVRIGAQILEALGEAHAHGVIHRDLKPENVMVEDRRNEPDHVTVLDFGIAKISDPGSGEGTLTQAGFVCGTPQYMSPEQARGKELDPRSDLYSMGVILYQMATARLPFEADTPVGFLTKHLTEPPAPLRERNPRLAISPRLEGLIGKALAKEPRDRPASADSMREELLACLQAGPRPAGPPGAAAAPPRRSAAVPLAVAAAVVVAGGGVGAWLAMGKKDANPAGTAAGTPTAAAGPAPAATPAAGPTPEATTTPTATATPTPTANPVPPPAPTARPPARRDPAKARALFAQAEEKRRALETEAAIKLYLRAEQADPDLHEVHKKLGQCYQLVGDIPRAREQYRRYLASRPADADKIQASLDLLR
jgi:serine/threonine-protein kinase